MDIAAPLPSPGPAPLPAVVRDRVAPWVPAAMVAGLIMLVVIVGMSIWLALRNQEALRVAEHTESVRSGVRDLLTAASDAETGQRGYLLTGRDIYLAPFRASIPEIPALLGVLRKELANDAPSQALLDVLNGAIAVKQNELERTLTLASAGRHDEALAVVDTDHGRDAMEIIRATAQRLTDIQEATVKSQLSKVDSSGRLLVSVDMAGLAMIVLLASAVGVGTRSTFATLRTARSELASANAELEAANDTLEARVAARTAELTEANDEIQRFAYIVSHDLRAPLVNVMGFTSELETATRLISHHLQAQRDAKPDSVPAEVFAAANEDLPEAARFIQASSAKMDRLINAILKLSREGRRVLTPERLDMQALLSGIADSLQHQADADGATVTIEAAPALIADRLVIEQIFSNLIENALKYLKPGRPGDIRVRGRSDGRVITYEVADNGRGIEARNFERVFELFRRAGDQNVPGEGIGLAHVRALVRRLDGRIGCESTLDVGSVFRLQLPVKASLQADVTIRSALQ